MCLLCAYYVPTMCLLCAYKYLPQQALLYVDKTAAKKARLAARRSSRSLLLQSLSFRNRAVRRVANRAVLGSGNLSGGAGSDGDVIRV